MPEMITGKKTQRYTTEFKVKAVEWSHQAHRSVKSVAEALDIHPFMLSRWRKEYGEGKFAMKRVKKAPAEVVIRNDAGDKRVGLMTLLEVGPVLDCRHLIQGRENDETGSFTSARYTETPAI